MIRAFAVYFQLVNIAEQHHRIRRKRYYERHTPDQPQRGSVEDRSDGSPRSCRELAAEAEPD